MSQGLQEVSRTSGADDRAIQSTKLIIDNDYANTVAGLIRHASGEIRMCSYAWRWYEMEPEIDIQKLNIELLRAADRGVKVRCLVDSEAMAVQFCGLGFNARSVVNTRMLHTKAFGIGDSALILGSHNLTKRATTDNFEMSVITYDFESITLYNEYFDKMWASRG